MDSFFTQTNCDRCPNPLDVRTTSWFNNDTICMACSKQEKVIKGELRKQGHQDAMEGCGYVPTI
jgi:hypothetical protein